MGKMVEVDIVETGKHYLKGQLISDKRPERPSTVPPPLKAGQVSGIPDNTVSIGQGLFEFLSQWVIGPYFCKTKLVPKCYCLLSSNYLDHYQSKVNKSIVHFYVFFAFRWLFGQSQMKRLYSAFYHEIYFTAHFTYA